MVSLHWTAVVVALLVAVARVSAAGTVPEQVHLSVIDSSSQTYAVQWVTFADTATSTLYLTGPSGKQVLTGRSFQYPDEDFIMWGGFVHEVNVTGLQPSTEYTYACGDDQGGYSASFTFVTLPAPGVASTVRVGVFGDHGLDYESDNTTNLLLALTSGRKIDMNIHMGDIAYTTSGIPIDIYEANQTRLDLWYNKIQSVAAQAPYMVAPGNQEFSFRFGAFASRWRMPSRESQAPETNLWYSYNVGPVHFVSISTEHHIDPASEQYAWLAADLAKASSAAARAQQPWIVVYGHRPLYCSNSPQYMSSYSDCYVIAPQLRVYLEELFHNNTVDLYMSGHMHDAEYSYPVYKGKVFHNYTNPVATVYAVSGFAGSREDFDNVNDTFTLPWSAWRQHSHFGIAVLTANASSLHFEYMYADDYQVHSDFMLIKSSPLDRFPPLHVADEEANLIPPPPLRAGQSLTGSVLTAMLEADSGPLVPFRSHGFNPNDIVSLIVGFFIGIGAQIGSVPSVIADYYPLYYDMTAAFDLVHDGLEYDNSTELGLGIQRLGLLFADVSSLVRDAGVFTALADVGDVVQYFMTHGMNATIKLETNKIIYHLSDILPWYKEAVDMWNEQMPEQVGINVGRIFSVLIGPPAPFAADADPALEANDIFNRALASVLKTASDATASAQAQMADAAAAKADDAERVAATRALYRADVLTDELV